MPGNEAPGVVVPLRQRPVDLVIVAFFCVNLFYIAYLFDFESLTVPNPYHFTYPLWPPPVFVNIVHWWGRHFDPLDMARPPFWKMTVWIEVIYFGPYYAAAIYAFVRGRDWIRVPSAFWAGLLSANTLIILSEEFSGPHRAPHPAITVVAYSGWLVFPVVVVLRVVLREHPFSRSSPAPDGAGGEHVRDGDRLDGDPQLADDGPLAAASAGLEPGDPDPVRA